MEILKKAGIIITKDKKIPAENVEKKIKRTKLNIEDIIDIQYIDAKEDLQRALSGMINPNMKEKEERQYSLLEEALLDFYAVKGPYNSIHLFRSKIEADDKALEFKSSVLTYKQIIDAF